MQLIDTLIATCDANWLAATSAGAGADADGAAPVFVVGLPRSGTTLIERILSSHSRVESVDETFFVEVALRRAGGLPPAGGSLVEVVRRAAAAAPQRIAAEYRQAVAYKLSGKPLFIEKLPENFSWLGFLARSFPAAKLLHVRRNPLDVCFAMYKQPFFRFAYNLDDLGTYYLAFERLRAHWRRLLGDRLVEVDYEAMTADPEAQTRALLDRLGLPFEQACLEFEQNAAPSASASSVQVREPVHTRSVLNWTHFASHLRPLQQRLEQAGIRTASESRDT